MQSPSKPFVVGAAVKTNPLGTLQGNFQCTLTPHGIVFKQGKKLEFLIPVGTRAEYLKANRMRLHLPEYQIEMTVTRMGAYTFRLTRDLVSFLNGQSAVPQWEDYKLPGYLWALALLPVGIPIMTMGGAIPGAIGGALVMVTLACLQNEEWSLPLRIAAALGVSVVAYVAFFFLVVQAAGGRPF